MPDFVCERHFLCAGPGSGFFAAGFASRLDGWLILAICGSDELVDIASCANLAVCQYMPNRTALLDYLSRPGWRRITLAGHSLGGAICQYLAYDLSRSRLSGSAPFDAWTFNGLGGVLGLKKLYSDVAKADLRSVPVTHFAHPRDVISKIGGNLRGELRLLSKPPLRENSHSIGHFLSLEGKSPLRSYTLSPDRPFNIPITAEVLGPLLREAVLVWLEGRRFDVIRRIIAMLPLVPRTERWEVLRLLVAMTGLPLSRLGAMPASAALPLSPHSP